MKAEQLWLGLWTDEVANDVHPNPPAILPSVGTVWREIGGHLWRVMSIGGRHINLNRADLTRKWNNMHGEALGYCVLIENFGRYFTAPTPKATDVV